MQVSLDKSDGFASALDSIRYAAKQDKPDPQRVADILYEQFDHYSWGGISSFLRTSWCSDPGEVR
jgi:hypothetical protein